MRVHFALGVTGLVVFGVVTALITTSASAGNKLAADRPLFEVHALPSSSSGSWSVACPTADRCTIAHELPDRTAILQFSPRILRPPRIVAWVHDRGVTSLVCASSSVCIVAGATIEFTLDGGITWHSGASTRTWGQVSAISCPSPAACLAVAGGRVWRGSPTAATWTPVTLALDNRLGSSIACPTSNQAPGSIDRAGSASCCSRDR